MILCTVTDVYLSIVKIYISAHASRLKFSDYVHFVPMNKYFNIVTVIGSVQCGRHLYFEHRLYITAL